MAPRDPPCGPALGEGRGPPGSTGPHGRRPPPSPLGTGMRAQAQPWHRHAHRHACAHPARGHGRPRAACTHGRAGTGTRTVGWALSKHTHAHTHPPPHGCSALRTLATRMHTHTHPAPAVRTRACTHTRRHSWQRTRAAPRTRTQPAPRAHGCAHPLARGARTRTPPPRSVAHTITHMHTQRASARVPTHSSEPGEAPLRPRVPPPTVPCSAPHRGPVWGRGSHSHPAGEAAALVPGGVAVPGGPPRAMPSTSAHFPFAGCSRLAARRAPPGTAAPRAPRDTHLRPGGVQRAPPAPTPRASGAAPSTTHRLQQIPFPCTEDKARSTPRGQIRHQQPSCSPSASRSLSRHPQPRRGAQLNPGEGGHLHPQEGPAGLAPGPGSCSTSGEGGLAAGPDACEEGVATPGPSVAPQPRVPPSWDTDPGVSLPAPPPGGRAGASCLGTHQIL